MSDFLPLRSNSRLGAEFELASPNYRRPLLRVSQVHRQSIIITYRKGDRK